MKWTPIVILALLPAHAMAQQPDVTKNIINPYYYCVGRAVGRQPDRFTNPEEAVERGFLACQTEELAIRTYAELSGLQQAQINAIVLSHRRLLKNKFVEELSKARK